MNFDHNFLFIVCLTALWYWTSAVSAVASQHLVEQSKINGNSSCPSALLSMATLSSLQLLMGLVVSLLLLSALHNYGKHRTVNDSFSTPNAIIPVLRKQDFVLGGFHFCGCLCTNLGYAYGSASLVQAVKMLEPIETLLLTAAARLIFSHKGQRVTISKVVAVVSIVGGTLVLLRRKKAFHSNPVSIIFALCSGLFMSCRNVAKKAFAVDDVKQGSTWLSKVRTGLEHFLRITASCTPVSVLLLWLTPYCADSILPHQILQWGGRAVFFHVFYNIASITVLSLVSAPTHSLLNAGKRICNVVVAAVVFAVPLGWDGLGGLSLATFGAILYVGVSLKRIRLYAFFFSLLLLVLSWVATAVWVSTSSDFSSTWSPGITLPVPTTNKFNFDNPVWPEAPPQPSQNCWVKFRNPDLSLCHILPWANFGDEIGPDVTKRLLELHFNCSAENVPVFDMGVFGWDLLNRTDHPVKNCLMTVGSLWRMIMSGDHVWGTGVAYDGTVKRRCRANKPTRVTNVTIYSSRGPLSAQEIMNHCNYTTYSYGESSRKKEIEGAGDAGFLVPFLFPELMRTETELAKHDFCVIPHKQEERNPIWHTGVTKEQILTVDRSWQNMTLDIQRCNRVLSSSLHGVIVAEALGIPVRRIRLTQKPGDLKFNDFYRSYRGYQPDIVGNVSGALETMAFPLPDYAREAYAKRILKTFPTHLFEVVYSSPKV